MRDGCNVVLFEDDPVLVQTIVESFESSPYFLPAYGTNLESALRIVDRMASSDPLHRVPCDVVILDANLSTEAQPRTGRDAYLITQKMRDLNLFSPNGRQGIKIIGFSASPMWSWGINVHADPGKFAPEKLPTVVKWLDPDAPWMRRN